MKSLFLSLLLSLFTLFNAFAGEWLQVPVNFSGNLNDVKFASSNVVYICGDSGAVFRSNNKGRSWARQSTPTKANLKSCYFLNEESGYVVGDSATFLKTVNGGTSWTKVPIPEIPENASFSSIYINNHHEVFLTLTNRNTFSGTVLKTSDGGSTWNKILAFSDILHGVTGKDNVLLATGYENFLKKSSDGGATWRDISPSNNMEYMSAEVINKNYYLTAMPGGAYKSTNGGKNWSHISLKTITYPVTEAIDFIDDQNGYLAGFDTFSSCLGLNDCKNGYIFKTKDGGNTWEKAKSDFVRITSLDFINEETGIAVGWVGAVYIYTSNYNLIQGNVFVDDNFSCTKESLETGIKNIVVKAEPGPYYSITDSTGNYRLPVLESGEYTVTPILENKKFVNPGCKGESRLIRFPGLNNSHELDFPSEHISCTDLEVVATSGRNRRCFTGTSTFTYKNKGSITAENAVLRITYPDFLEPLKSSIPWTSKTEKEITYNLPPIRPGEFKTISVKDSVICGIEEIRGMTVCIEATISPIGSCNTSYTQPSSEWDKSSISVTGKCSKGTAVFNITNSGDGDMTGSHDYRVYVNDTLISVNKFSLKSGETLIVDILAEGKTVRLEADQHTKHPGKSRPRETIEGCKRQHQSSMDLGYILSTPQDDMDEFKDITCGEIIDSYDPNDKNVSPEGATEKGFIIKTDFLDYLIRFQNTGTDTAFNIVIKDTLSTNLDIDKLEVLDASHPFSTTLTGSTTPVLTFSFRNINLPDSTRNEALSHGFIKFRIGQKSTNTIGTKITNKSYIYFDYNSPIVTNETMNEVWDGPSNDFSQEYRVLSSSVITKNRSKSSLDVSTYPNPFSNNINIYLKKGYHHISVISIQGEVVMEKAVASTSDSEVKLNLSNISKGLYTIRIVNSEGEVSVGKVSKVD